MRQAAAARFSPLSTSTPIQHVIVVVQVGRSFDSLFDGYPRADTAKRGLAQGEYVPLKPITLQTTGKLGEGVTLPASTQTFDTEYDHGKMDGFNLLRFGVNGNGQRARLYPYAYVVRRETKPYWNLARQYALADHMFATEQAASFAGSEVLIAGSNVAAPTE
jgi:phospholipase C